MPRCAHGKQLASTLTTFDAFIKERYTTEKIEDLTMSDRPLWAQMPKDDKCSGDNFIEPIIFGNPQGLGATLSKAQTAAGLAGGAGNVKGRKWSLTFGDYSAVVEIGDKVMKAARDNFGAFLRNKATEIDGLWEAFADTQSAYLYGNGGQAIGLGTLSSGILTLDNAEDVVNFEVGQALVSSANDGSDPTHVQLTGTGYVISINRSEGKVTLGNDPDDTTATNPHAAWLNGGSAIYVFRDGDFGGSGATAIFKGLGAWIPSSAPSASDSFYGVNRSVDDRLSGVRLASAELTGKGREERIKLLVTRIKGRFGGRGKLSIFLNTEQWQCLANELEDKGTRPVGDGGTAKFNFQKIQLAAGGGMIDIYPDPFCPALTAFALALDTWKLRSYDAYPHVVNGDGLEMLRKVGSNDYEYRLTGYPTFSTRAPCFNGRVTLPPATP